MSVTALEIALRRCTDTFLDDGEFAKVYVRHAPGHDAVVVKEPKGEWAAEHVWSEARVLRAVSSRVEKAYQDRQCAHASLDQKICLDSPTCICENMRRHLAVLWEVTADGHLILDFCPGRRLDALLWNGWRLDATQAFYIILQVCNVLEWLQHQFPGFRHCDLHLGNVLVQTDVSDSWSHTHRYADIDLTGINVTVIDFARAGQVNIPADARELPEVCSEKYASVAVDVLHFVEYLLAYTTLPHVPRTNVDTRVWLCGLASALSTLPETKYLSNEVSCDAAYTHVNPKLHTFTEVINTVLLCSPL